MRPCNYVIQTFHKQLVSNVSMNSHVTHIRSPTDFDEQPTTSRLTIYCDRGMDEYGWITSHSVKHIVKYDRSRSNTTTENVTHTIQGHSHGEMAEGDGHSHGEMAEGDAICKNKIDASLLP